jgi:hypothetical protein
MGIVQCDRYGPYKQLVGSASDDTTVALAVCSSRVRRGFYDLAKTGSQLRRELYHALLSYTRLKLASVARVPTTGVLGARRKADRSWRTCASG